MRLAQVKQVSGGHGGKVWVKKHPTKCGARHGNRGLEQSRIAQTFRTPIMGYRVRVQCEHIVNRKKTNVHDSSLG